jgi:hypothetical protein
MMRPLIDGFSSGHGFQLKDAFLVKPMVSAEKALYFKAFFQVIASQYELCGFTGGQDVAVVFALDAAEFGEIAAVGEMLGDDGAKEARLEVGGEGEEEEDVFIEGGLVGFGEVRDGRAVVVECQRGYFDGLQMGPIVCLHARSDDVMQIA